MTMQDGTSAAISHAEIRRYCSAAARARADAGMPPGEQHDEAGGTAFYWTKGDPVLGHGPWAHGIAVFWGTRGGRHGWGFAPLDAAGDPALDVVTWLPVAPSIAPALLAEHLRGLIAEGVTTPSVERR
ncbi:hypothetical protein [Streptomyces sp. HC307]|uniref:hypothetical protein n=1 Tax=Streptomyces flavusporus TaxID=3385496 RepID=UPI0039175379